MLETADLVTFTEEVLNGKLHFLYMHKVRKVADPDFFKKNSDGSGEGPISPKTGPKTRFWFLTVFELWPKNLWTTQNARFFKMQYLTK